MKKKVEINELEKVSGGSTEIIHEVHSQAYSAFMQVYTSGGSVSDLDNIMKEIEEKIVAYSTKEGKLIGPEADIVRTFIKSDYDNFVNLIKNNPLIK